MKRKMNKEYINGDYMTFVKAKVCTGNEYFATHGKVKKGCQIHEVVVVWDESWESLNDDNEEGMCEAPYFWKTFKTLQPAYALAFKLGAGLVNHTHVFTRKQLNGDHIKDWVSADGLKLEGRVRFNIDVRVEVSIYDDEQDS